MKRNVFNIEGNIFNVEAAAVNVQAAARPRWSLQNEG